MEKVVSKDGTQIAYDRTGTGPALILVDGALCYRNFGPSGPLAGCLASRFTVFTYDRRGRGDSGDTPPYAIDREVEDLDALIGAAGGRALVYGISSGAALALEAASRGLGITKLAVYEPPFMLDDSRPQPPEDVAEQMTRLVASGRRGDAVALLMHLVGLPAEVIEAMRQDPVWPMLEGVAHTLAYDMTIMSENHWFLNKCVTMITVPTLVMDGGTSPTWAARVAEALEDAIPNARRRTLPGQTHDVASEAMGPVLEAFFLGQGA